MTASKTTKPLTRKNISGSLELHEKLTSYGNIEDSYSSLIMDIIEWAEARGMNKASLDQWRKSKGK
jgi:hypothetical protein